MGQQDKVDITENFTEDIEATIDDLFAPVKEIEIDPLTNEVKERAVAGAPGPAEAEASDGSDVSSENGGGAQGENVIDLGLELEDVEFEADAQKANVEAEAQGEELVLEPEESAVASSDEAFQKFREAVMSLEWEIDEATIDSALLHAEELRPAFTDRAAHALLDSMLVILRHMKESPDDVPSASTCLIKGADVLSKSMSGEADSAAVQGVAHELSGLVSGKGLQESSTSEAEEEPVIELEVEDEDTANGKAPAAEQAEAQVEGIEIELELDSQEELQVETGAEEPDSEESGAGSASEKTPETSGDVELEVEQEVSAEPQLEVQAETEQEAEPEEKEEISSADTVEESSGVSEETEEMGVEIEPVSGTSRASEQAGGAPGDVAAAATGAEVVSDSALSEKYEMLKDAVEQHLMEIDRIAAKIRPVEKVLSGTKGMDKLYAFQKAIRTALETQRKELASALGENVQPPRESTGIPEEKPPAPEKEVQRHSVNGCPWDKLVLIDYGNGKIAVPVDMIAFSGPLSGRFKKKMKKEDQFALSWLKPWPWVKIKPSLSGHLSEKDEKELKTIVLPVINTQVSKASGVDDFLEEIKKPAAIIIYSSEGKGGVIYLDGEPSVSEPMSPEEWTESSGSDPNFAGTAIIGEETVPVIAA